ncbi:unnamed protein product [Vitrella brassicaformis CCMP3155]|uniref:Uncharacterized protein n=2 Tax=Vitrella brassicaformis TaxID=1169539 RepID=A0A0G4EW13_VITBC|nr:unnamed protein product [Vitrella brassicaformis CCMP3155]|eukprot:CEM02627.1 unnamed protein product [Vitrella brassicaformis CCMP3155]
MTTALLLLMLMLLALFAREARGAQDKDITGTMEALYLNMARACYTHPKDCRECAALWDENGYLGGNGLFGYDSDLVEDAVAAEKEGIMRMCEDNKESLKQKSKMRGFHPVERSVRVEAIGATEGQALLLVETTEKVVRSPHKLSDVIQQMQRSDRFGVYMRVRNGKIGYMIEVNDPHPESYTKEKEKTSDLLKAQMKAFVEKDKCDELDSVLSADFEGNAFWQHNTLGSQYMDSLPASQFRDACHALHKKLKHMGKHLHPHPEIEYTIRELFSDPFSRTSMVSIDLDWIRKDAHTSATFLMDGENQDLLTRLKQAEQKSEQVYAKIGQMEDKLDQTTEKAAQMNDVIDSLKGALESARQEAERVERIDEEMQRESEAALDQLQRAVEGAERTAQRIREEEKRAAEQQANQPQGEVQPTETPTDTDTDTEGEPSAVLMQAMTEAMKEADQREAAGGMGSVGAAERPPSPASPPTIPTAGEGEHAHEHAQGHGAVAAHEHVAEHEHEKTEEAPEPALPSSLRVLAFFKLNGDNMKISNEVLFVVPKPKGNTASVQSALLDITEEAPGMPKPGYWLIPAGIILGFAVLGVIIARCNPTAEKNKPLIPTYQRLNDPPTRRSRESNHSQRLDSSDVP